MKQQESTNQSQIFITKTNALLKMNDLKRRYELLSL